VVVRSSPNVNGFLLRQTTISEKPASAGFFMGNAFICHDEMRIVVSFSPIPESTHHKGHKIW
ncbi:hypothetical protein, partial [Salmonella enterica]|uniref:hypothetical protein n=1 Tax=Salmonella enterica TaxID=28901 RepID=UPI003EDC4C21